MSFDIDLSAIPPSPRIEPWPFPILNPGLARCPLCDFYLTAINATGGQVIHACSRDRLTYLVCWYEDGTTAAIQVTGQPAVIKHVSGEPLALDQKEWKP